MTHTAQVQYRQYISIEKNNLPSAFPSVAAQAVQQPIHVPLRQLCRARVFDRLSLAVFGVVCK